jgi:hypothetical protein
MRAMKQLARVREAQRRQVTPTPDPSVENAIRFLVARGLDESDVRFGSIPATSLTFMARTVAPHLPSGRPVRALHIGNFVGVSLCFLTAFLWRHDEGSVVLSIDPNVPHRGVSQPQGHVLALLQHHGLLANSLIVPGYTLEQSFGDPGAPDAANLSRSAACVNVLKNLATLGAESFDLVLIDGNHEHVERELNELRRLIAPGSIVVLDDIDDWQGVREALEGALAHGRSRELGSDGRLAVLQLQQPASS